MKVHRPVADAVIMTASGRARGGDHMRLSLQELKMVWMHPECASSLTDFYIFLAYHQLLRTLEHCNGCELGPLAAGRGQDH